jgi:hypothetical protein
MPRAIGSILLIVAWSGGLALAQIGRTNPVGPADMVAPCRLAFVDVFEDGGTVGGELHDDRILRFCLDGRMKTMEPANGAAVKASITEPRQFYVGAPHPSNPLARALEIGGAEEAELLRLLRSCVDAAFAAEEQELMFSEYAKVTTTTERVTFVTKRKLSAAQGLALRVNQLLAARGAWIREHRGVGAKRTP